MADSHHNKHFWSFWYKSTLATQDGRGRHHWQIVNLSFYFLSRLALICKPFSVYDVTLRKFTRWRCVGWLCNLGRISGEQTQTGGLPSPPHWHTYTHTPSPHTHTLPFCEYLPRLSSPRPFVRSPSPVLSEVTQLLTRTNQQAGSTSLFLFGFMCPAWVVVENHLSILWKEIYDKT